MKSKFESTKKRAKFNSHKTNTVNAPPVFIRYTMYQRTSWRRRILTESDFEAPRTSRSQLDNGDRNNEHSFSETRQVVIPLDPNSYTELIQEQQKMSQAQNLCKQNETHKCTINQNGQVLCDSSAPETSQQLNTEKRPNTFINHQQCNLSIPSSQTCQKSQPIGQTNKHAQQSIHSQQQPHHNQGSVVGGPVDRPSQVFQQMPMPQQSLPNVPRPHTVPQQLHLQNPRLYQPVFQPQPPVRPWHAQTTPPPPPPTPYFSYLNPYQQAYPYIPYWHLQQPYPYPIQHPTMPYWQPQFVPEAGNMLTQASQIESHGPDGLNPLHVLSLLTGAAQSIVTKTTSRSESVLSPQEQHSPTQPSLNYVPIVQNEPVSERGTDVRDQSINNFPNSNSSDHIVQGKYLLSEGNTTTSASASPGSVVNPSHKTVGLSVVTNREGNYTQGRISNEKNFHIFSDSNKYVNAMGSRFVVLTNGENNSLQNTPNLVSREMSPSSSRDTTPRQSGLTNEEINIYETPIHGNHGQNISGLSNVSNRESSISPSLSGITNGKIYYLYQRSNSSIPVHDQTECKIPPKGGRECLNVQTDRSKDMTLSSDATPDSPISPMSTLSDASTIPVVQFKIPKSEHDGLFLFSVSPPPCVLGDFTTQVVSAKSSIFRRIPANEIPMVAIPDENCQKHVEREGKQLEKSETQLQKPAVKRSSNEPDCSGVVQKKQNVKRKYNKKNT